MIKCDFAKVAHIYTSLAHCCGRQQLRARFVKTLKHNPKPIAKHWKIACNTTCLGIFQFRNTLRN